MGYTMELRALSLAALAAELARPTLDPADVRFDPADASAQRVRERWAELAASVAQAIGRAAAQAPTGGGPVPVAWPESGYVQAVARHLGHWYGALNHSSSGGDWFRGEVLPGPAADVLGRDLVSGLVHRPFTGLTWVEYPMVGWAEIRELRAAADRMAALPPDALYGGAESVDDADEPVEALVAAVTRAAATGQDLLAVYG